MYHKVDEAAFAKISRSYEAHPLRADTILGRVCRRRGSLDELTEMDLAVDEETGLTDQNHAGGVGAVLAIARSVGIRGDERVLDVGTGLGGTPRLLAHLFGCHAHGVELTESRHRDAVALTRLVRLDKLVSITRGDFLEVELTDGPYDLVIGQAAFMHFVDQAAAYRKCAEALRPGGWLVVEDAYLRREPAGDEMIKLQSLFDVWNGRFHMLDCWRDWVANAGLSLCAIEDSREATVRESANLSRLWEEPELLATPEELLGCRIGSDLTASGLLGYVRLVARKFTDGVHAANSSSA